MAYEKVPQKKKKITKTLVWVYDYVWLSVCLPFFSPINLRGICFPAQPFTSPLLVSSSYICICVSLSEGHEIKCVAHLCLSQPVCPVQRNILFNVIFCTQKTNGLQLKITFHYALVNWFSKLIQKILITISLSLSLCFQIASFVQPGVVLQSQMIKNSSKSLKLH